METVIILCLLGVILLLLQERFTLKKVEKRQEKRKIINPALPDIMGQPKPVKRQSTVLGTDKEPEPEELAFNPDELDIEYDHNEELAMQVPSEELDEVFSDTPDWGEEEEEWQATSPEIVEDELAQGVSFDDLNEMGELLKEETPEPASRQKAVEIARRIQGTELYSLLEDSVEGASRKIAELLDQGFSPLAQHTASTEIEDEARDFDIGKFV